MVFSMIPVFKLVKLLAFKGSLRALHTRGQGLVLTLALVAAQDCEIGAPERPGGECWWVLVLG